MSQRIWWSYQPAAETLNPGLNESLLRLAACLFRGPDGIVEGWAQYLLQKLSINVLNFTANPEQNIACYHISESAEATKPSQQAN